MWIYGRGPHLLLNTPPSFVPLWPSLDQSSELRSDHLSNPTSGKRNRQKPTANSSNSVETLPIHLSIPPTLVPRPRRPKHWTSYTWRSRSGGLETREGEYTVLGVCVGIPFRLTNAAALGVLFGTVVGNSASHVLDILQMVQVTRMPSHANKHMSRTIRVRLSFQLHDLSGSLVDSTLDRQQTRLRGEGACIITR